MASLWNAISKLLGGNDGPESEAATHIISRARQLFGNSCDFVSREVRTDGTEEALVMYLSSIVDQQRLAYEIIDPLQQQSSNSNIRTPNIGSIANAEEAIHNLVMGNILIALPRQDRVIYAEMPDVPGRSVSEPSAESTIAGPQEAFVENLRTNLAMVRGRLRTPALHCVPYTIGERTKTSVYLLYLEDLAPPEMVSGLKDMLAKTHVGELLDISYLEALIGASQFSPFPQAFYTQRPDKVVGNLLEGRLALLASGSPNALVLPSAFMDLFQSPADYYSRSLTTILIRMARVIGFFLATTLPALYISVTSFDFEVLPVNLAIPIANFRAGIPFPPHVEILLMVIIVDVLQEGASRLPAKIGQTLAVVGGFVLGQAVIQAKLVSPLAVIVVAASVIGAFTLPNYELNGLVRAMRYALVAGGAILTGVGITIVWCAFLIHMCSLEILGVPYLRPVAPFRLEQHQDFIYRVGHSKTPPSGKK